MPQMRRKKSTENNNKDKQINDLEKTVSKVNKLLNQMQINFAKEVKANKHLRDKIRNLETELNNTRRSVWALERQFTEFSRRIFR